MKELIKEFRLLLFEVFLYIAICVVPDSPEGADFTDYLIKRRTRLDK